MKVTFKRHAESKRYLESIGCKLLLSTLMILLGSALPSAGENSLEAFPSHGKIKVRPTHGQITDRRKEFQSDGKIELAEDPVKMKTIQSGKTGSLIKRSAILSHRKSWTIVPKEAVLYVPKNFASRVNGKREGKLVSWREVLAQNRVWLQLHNVSVAQARGEIPLGEEAVTNYQRTGRVVVAVCHEGPISVKPRKEPGGSTQSSSGVSPTTGTRRSALK